MKELESLGLTQGEIKVYLSLLRLGSTKTGEISKRAKVSRSKIYELLDKLIAKGLVSCVTKENVKYFEASNPENLKSYIEQKKLELNEQEKTINSVIPSLKKLQQEKSDKHHSKVFEGYKGIKVVFNEILSTLKKGDEYLAFAVEEENYDEEFSLFISNYHKQREEKGIKVKLLGLTDIKSKLMKDLKKHKRIEFKFTQEKFPTSTLIFGDKIFIFIWKNPSGTLIESKEISKRYKEMFLDLWQRAKDI